MFSSISFCIKDNIYSFTWGFSVPYPVFCLTYSIISACVFLFRRNDTLKVLLRLYLFTALCCASVIFICPRPQEQYIMRAIYLQIFYLFFICLITYHACMISRFRLITPLPGYNTYRISLSLCRLINKKEFQYMIFAYWLCQKL